MQIRRRRGGAHVMAAMRADFEAGFEFFVENHLLAVGALAPEVVRHVGAAKQGADFRADEFGEPGHGGELAGFLG